VHSEALVGVAVDVAEDVAQSGEVLWRGALSSEKGKQRMDIVLVR
jgi:hypothetical protein